MATVNVGTCAEFIAAISTNSDINITADLDFNEDPYYRQTENFATLNIVTGGSKTINGNGHTLSNIYIRPQKCFIVGNLTTSNSSCLISFNDLKFEFITNDSTLIYFEQNKEYTLSFNNCEFNCRSYSIGNSGDTAYPPILKVKGDSGNYIQRLQCTNCVFNIYMTTASSNQSCLLYSYADNGTAVADRTRFESCIFKIRNATDKRVVIVNCRDTQTTFSNCAIFYNDVGNVKPTYEISKVNYVSAGGAATFANSYVAAFGDVPSDEKPIFLFGERYNGSGSYYITTSFYDKDKIIMGWKASFPIENYANGMKGLTTTECKSSSKLSEIGYIFCEEI